MAHYISVLMPLRAGGWRALFPDIPDCEVEGDSLDATMLRARLPNTYRAAIATVHPHRAN